MTYVAQLVLVSLLKVTGEERTAQDSDPFEIPPGGGVSGPGPAPCPGNFLQETATLMYGSNAAAIRLDGQGHSDVKTSPSPSPCLNLSSPKSPTTQAS